MTTFIIRGDQLIVDPSVGTNSSNGTATVQWGRQLWSRDHSIEITSANDTGTELTGQSGITGLRVFNSAGVLVAEYRPMNPGQTAGIQSDLSGLGDGYARINTSVMQPSPGAPWIGPIMITNGDHSFSSLPTTFHVGNGAYDIAPAVQHAIPATQHLAGGDGNDLLNGGDGNDTLIGVPCFTRGTRIRTPAGDVEVQDLCVGDLVTTLDDGPLPIVWIGHRPLSRAELLARPELRPVRIPAGALGEGLPLRDLLVSPQHRVLVRSRIAKRMFAQPEVLVAAKHLVGTAGIAMDDSFVPVEYWHVMFKGHKVILSEGARTESLFTGSEALKAVGAEARREIEQLFPHLLDHAPAPARLLISGRTGRTLATRHEKNRVAICNSEEAL